MLIINDKKTYLMQNVNNCGVLFIGIPTRVEYLGNLRKFKALFELLPEDLLQNMTKIHNEGMKYIKSKENLRSAGKLTDEVEELLNAKIEKTDWAIAQFGLFCDVVDSVKVVNEDVELWHDLFKNVINVFFGSILYYPDEGEEKTLTFEELEALVEPDLFKALVGTIIVFTYVSCRYSHNITLADKIATDSSQKIIWNGLASDCFSGLAIRKWRAGLSATDTTLKIVL